MPSWTIDEYAAYVVRNKQATPIKKAAEPVKKPDAPVTRGTDLEESFLAILRLYRLPEPEREVLYAPPRKVRCDFLFRQAGLIVEMEGGVWSRGKTGHNNPSGIENDCERSRLASLHGLKVFRVTRKALDEKAGEIMEQIGAILLRWPAPDACLAVPPAYSGCYSSAQRAELALRAAAIGAGHPSYVGPNGDGE